KSRSTQKRISSRSEEKQGRYAHLHQFQIGRIPAGACGPEQLNNQQQVSADVKLRQCLASGKRRGIPDDRANLRPAGSELEPSSVERGVSKCRNYESNACSREADQHRWERSYSEQAQNRGTQTRSRTT